VNKTNICTKFQFYWYYDSTCFRQPLRPSSGVLSRTSALVHFMQLWWPFVTRSRMELYPTPGRKRSSKLHKMYQSRCTAKNSWWWAERLPETCRVVIPIKLEFSASVGLIHRVSVMMHGHMILKFKESSLKVFNYPKTGAENSRWCRQKCTANFWYLDRRIIRPLLTLQTIFTTFSSHSFKTITPR